MSEEERNVYHCRIEKTRFDSKSGKRLSVPSIQKFGEKEFKLFIKRNLEAQGWTVDILFDPTVKVAPKVAKPEPKEEPVAAPEAEAEAETEEVVETAPEAQEEAVETTKKVAPRKSK